ncbi:MAG: endonuclease III [Phycisphaeraceae bacterium]|nr:endonuclease III [Phycisphaeraceae bacterium]
MTGARATAKTRAKAKPGGRARATKKAAASAAGKRSKRGAPKANHAAAERKRAQDILRLLEAQYPDAHCALVHQDAFELLVATILSAQCTDVRVNMVTPALFARYPGPGPMAQADTAELEGLIRSTGFYHNKAKSLWGASRRIVAQFGGQVPATMEELLTLPGVARKTANVVLGNAFGKNEGVVVDTHVGRLAGRMGLSKETDPRKIETDLMALFPREKWTLLAHQLIFHGRQVCAARKPKCAECRLAELCPKVGV